MRKCPFCAEEIQDEAIKCRYCGESVEPVRKKSNAPSTGRLILWVVGGLVTIWLCGILTFLPRTETPNTRTRDTPDRPTATTPKARPFVHAANRANIRRGPGTNFAVVEQAEADQRLFYEIQEGDWYKLVATDKNPDRYIHESVVRSAAVQQFRDNADLAVANWSWRREHGYAIAEGSVKNVSGQRLENVQAVVEFLTDSGDFITSDSAIVEYNPLLSGQSTPFKVYARWNPAMKRARLSFKTLFGSRLSHYSE